MVLRFCPTWEALEAFALGLTVGADFFKAAAVLETMGLDKPAKRPVRRKEPKGLTMIKGSRKSKRKKGGEEGGGGENSPMILRAKSLVNSFCFQSSS